MQCPNCLHFNSARADKCEMCGHSVTAEPTAAPRKTVGAGSAGLRQAGECRDCGRKNPSGAIKCKECGAALAKPRLRLKPKEGGGIAIRSRLERTYLICPPLPPLLLEDGTRYVLGRGDQADIMLPGELVSRQHAALEANDGSWYLQDLGSSNGTFKNGARVEEPIEIEDGDDIVIGGFHMGVQVRKGSLGADSVALPEVTSASTVTINPEDLFPKGHAESGAVALEGRLEEVPIVEILQLLRLGERSGELLIDGSDRGAGIVLVVGGEIYAAAVEGEGGSFAGKDALFQIGMANTGEFRFRRSSWSGEREIKEPTQVLLQKMQRLRSEGEAAAE